MRKQKTTKLLVVFTLLISFVFSANLALVYINGMFATYTDDYTIAGSTASGSPTVLTWLGTAMASPYTLKVGDIVEVLY